jgi:hypothetical protein
MTLTHEMDATICQIVLHLYSIIIELHVLDNGIMQAHYTNMHVSSHLFFKIEKKRKKQAPNLQ